MGEPARQLPYEVIGSAHQEPPWLEQRKSGIGASEISIILGESKWSSRLTLYYEKIGEQVRDEEEEQEWLFWGKTLEPAIVTELARRAEVRIDRRQPLLRSTEHPWAMATPDAMTTDGEPVEAKNIAWGYDENEWEIGIPPQYFYQCQHQMLVSGAQRCLFGALLWGSRMLWEWVPRSDEAIDRIIVAGSDFWRRVETRNPPPSDGHPHARKTLGKLAVVDDAVELYEPVEIGDTGQTLGEMLNAWQSAEADYAAAKQNEKRSKRLRDACADEIAKALGRHREGYTATGWDIRWKTVNRRGYQVEPTSYDQLKIKPPKN